MLKPGDTLNDNTIIDLCGEGAYASVFKVNDRISSNNFALKLCNAETQDEINRFKDENRILHILKTHTNVVVPYSDIIEVPAPYIYYLMELADCSLDDLMIEKYEEVTDERRIEIFSKICDGLKHAHDNNIIHRDLHWGNVLIFNESEIKINDFGKAKDFISYRKANSETPCWGYLVSPPEFLFGLLDNIKNIKDCVPGDIYALGIILYYLFEDSPDEFVTKLQNSIRRFKYSDSIVLEELNLSEKIELYEKWTKSVDFSESLIVNCIKDSEMKEKINKIIKRATILDFRLRYQDISQILEDLKSI